MNKYELINIMDDLNMKTISKNIIHNENTEILYNIGNACIMYLEDDDKIQYLIALIGLHFYLCNQALAFRKLLDSIFLLYAIL
jgi:hypothetical protein